jgi:choline dehydrogenase
MFHAFSPTFRSITLALLTWLAALHLDTIACCILNSCNVSAYPARDVLLQGTNSAFELPSLAGIRLHWSNTRHILQVLPLTQPLVVGGGVAGLTVANRLTEDGTINVLVLEAGPADTGEQFIEVPGMIGDGIGTIYDWNLSTVAQGSLDGDTRNIPQGHGLGGGSLINGMLWNRGGIHDYEDWVQLGNPGWSWDDMLPYFQRSESFTPAPSVDIAMQFSIETNVSEHGTVGPVNVSYPRSWYWPASQYFFSALNQLGIPTAYDANNGEIAGASFLPLSADPVSATRSSARRAYYDSIASRSNLWISTGQYVTEVIFGGQPAPDLSPDMNENVPAGGQGSSPGVPGGIFGGPQILSAREQPSDAGLVASGVVFASDAQSPREIVSATREVIIAAGALHSPQLLMLSGIGSAAALQSHGIAVNIDLPGVGQNLQDHGLVWAEYPFVNPQFPTPDSYSNQTFAAEAWTEYSADRSGPLSSAAMDGVAFMPLPYLESAAALVTAASEQPADQFLPAGMDGTVALGFSKQLALAIAALSDTTRASYEIINANDGVLTVANMRPLSRGTVTLASSEPFMPPVVDPRYCSNPIDAQVLLAALRFNEQIVASSSFPITNTSAYVPAHGASDEDVLTFVAQNMQTEYHPAGSCAMMPPAFGGVVSPELLVHGTSNLRGSQMMLSRRVQVLMPSTGVVDASIIPMLPAAHLQAMVYGIAEKVCLADFSTAILS